MGKKSRENRARKKLSATVTPMVGGGHLITYGTGQHEEVRNRPLPTDVPGEHLWVVTGAWVVDPSKFDASVPGSNLGLLDHENVLSIAGPGCFKCEKEFTPELAAQPCNGSLTDPMP